MLVSFHCRSFLMQGEKNLKGKLKFHRQEKICLKLKNLLYREPIVIMTKGGFI